MNCPKEDISRAMADRMKKNKEALSRRDWVWLRNWLELKETKMVDS